MVEDKQTVTILLEQFNHMCAELDELREYKKNSINMLEKIYDEIIKVLEQEIKQSITLQRPNGRWIEVLEHKDGTSSTWHYECSECGARSYKGIEPLEKYCPNCGIEMKGEGK